MKKTVFILYFSIVSLLLMNVVDLQAQTGRGRGRAVGTVMDQSGKPIANAKVEVIFKDQTIKLNATSDKNGKWAVIGIGTGQYKIKVSATGYEAVEKFENLKQLELNPSIDIKLKIAETPVGDDDTMKIIEKGEKLFNDRKYPEAIEQYQLVLTKFPILYKVKYKICDCYRENDELDKAITCYEEVIVTSKEKNDLNTAAQALGTIGGVYLRKENMSKAQEYFKQSIEVNPENETLAYNVGEIYFNSGDTENAIKYFQMASEIKTTWADPLEKLGYVYLNKGDYPKAIESFKKFLELDPNSDKAAAVQEVIKSIPQK